LVALTHNVVIAVGLRFEAQWW